MSGVAVADALNVIARPKVQWRMSTAWSPALKVMQRSAQRLAKVVEETSGGRFRIAVFAGGHIMQDSAYFDGTSQGTIEAFMAAPSYWAEKEPVIEWFQTVHFSINEALPVDRQWPLDYGVAAVHVYGRAEFHTKNAIALERFEAAFKGKGGGLRPPAPAQRDLKNSRPEVVREESEKTLMAKKVHASFAKFQVLVGPWDHVAGAPTISSLRGEGVAR